jgi:hypothetical protein
VLRTGLSNFRFLPGKKAFAVRSQMPSETEQFLRGKTAKVEVRDYAPASASNSETMRADSQPFFDKCAARSGFQVTFELRCMTSIRK